MTVSLPSPELVKTLDNKLHDLATFVLENEPALSQTCKARYATLPPTHRSALKSLVRKQQTNNTSGRKLRQQKLFKVKNVEPSEELQGIITTWTANFESFFQHPAHLTPKNHYDITASFARVGRNEAKRGVAVIQ